MYLITQEGIHSLSILGFFNSEEEAVDWWVNEGEYFSDKDYYHSYALYELQTPVTVEKEDVANDIGVRNGLIPHLSVKTLRFGTAMLHDNNF